MRFILALLLSLSFMFPSHRAYAQGSSGGLVPSITIAGTTLPLSMAVVVTCWTTNNNQYITCYRNGAAYQVPAGKTLVIVAAKVYGVNTVASGIRIGYGDTVVSTTVAPTNSVEIKYTGATLTASQGPWAVSMGNSVSYQWNDGASMYIEIPASKYVWINGIAAAETYATLLCYLK